MHIDDYHFGTIVIDGQSYRSDLMICGEELHERWWRREGHCLCLEDLEWMLRRNPDVLIIGKGNVGCMEVPGHLVDQLLRRGIEVRIANTGEAVEVYNQMVAGKGGTVGATFHLTC